MLLDASVREIAFQIRAGQLSPTEVVNAHIDRIESVNGVLNALAADRFETTLAELSKTMFFVGETTPGHVLLRSFLQHRTHLFGVVNDHGDITGIVSLEDVLESLIGEEIVDESDVAVDMREVARRRKKEIFEGLDAEEAAGEDPDHDEEQ